MVNPLYLAQPRYISLKTNQNASYFLVLLLIIFQNVYGQVSIANKKGKLQLDFAFSFLPVQKENANLYFSYIDGEVSSEFVPDTITAHYTLENQHFNSSIALGISYYLRENFKLSLDVRPHLNSFLSNQAKNGEVYGIQFDFSADLHTELKEKLNLSYGISTSRIIGGYGITSGGASNKDDLVVNRNELYDNDIGFHIIDNSWGISPRIGLNYWLTKSVSIFSDLGYQMNFGRTSRMNFAGFLENGDVKWNKKSYDDSDIKLTVDNKEIENTNTDKLPFDFNGFRVEFGITVGLNKKNKNET